MLKGVIYEIENKYHSHHTNIINNTMDNSNTSNTNNNNNNTNNNNNIISNNPDASITPTTEKYCIIKFDSNTRHETWNILYKLITKNCFKLFQCDIDYCDLTENLQIQKVINNNKARINGYYKNQIKNNEMNDIDINNDEEDSKCNNNNNNSGWRKKQKK